MNLELFLVPEIQNDGISLEDGEVNEDTSPFGECS